MCLHWGKDQTWKQEKSKPKYKNKIKLNTNFQFEKQLHLAQQTVRQHKRNSLDVSRRSFLIYSILNLNIYIEICFSLTHVELYFILLYCNEKKICYLNNKKNEININRHRATESGVYRGISIKTLYKCALFFVVLTSMKYEQKFSLHFFVSWKLITINRKCKSFLRLSRAVHLKMSCSCGQAILLLLLFWLLTDIKTYS